MNVNEIKKTDKKELFEKMDNLQKKIEIEKSKDMRNKTLIVRLGRDIKKIRRYLYGCVYCAEATLGLAYDKNGFGKECIIKDCGKNICPYHDYFYGNMDVDQKEIEANLRAVLNDLLKNI